MSESAGATGGYTVPPESAGLVLGQLQERAVLRGLVWAQGGLLPMGSASLRVPTPDVTTVQPAGVSALLAGVTASWTGEAQAEGESEPAAKMVELVPWELAAYAVVSRPLADDSPALAAWLIRLFAAALDWHEEYA